jgi:SAM-dependent methyltransferase
MTAVSEPSASTLSPSPDAVRQLFGPFRALHEARLPGTTVVDLYDATGAELYETFINPIIDDLAPFLRAARGTGGPVLDLACGSGRLSLALAQRGFDVTGVDLSGDMLALLSEKAERESIAVRRRLTLLHGDICALDDLPLVAGQFALVTLAATSLVLVPDAARRAAVFTAVAGLLARDGCLALDLVAHPVADPLASGDRYAVWRHPAEDVITLFGERLTEGPNGLCQQVNFLTERDGPGGHERRLVTSVKAVLDVGEIIAELARAGFEAQVTPRSTAGIAFLRCTRSPGSTTHSAPRIHAATSLPNDTEGR